MYGGAMHTKKYLDAMNKCKECLDPLEEYKLLAEALTYLVNEAEFFEKYIGKEERACDNHFKNHFKSFLEVPFEKITQDECVALYEDVAMLFREKQLRLGLSCLDEVEIAFLKDFEKRVTDKNCLAYQWYFEKLPLKVVVEVSEVMVHKY